MTFLKTQICCTAYLDLQDSLGAQRLSHLVVVVKGLEGLRDLVRLSCLADPRDLWLHLGRGRLLTVMEP